MDLVERERLYSTGIGFVDAHLLASTLLTPRARLWTRDRRLHEAAERLDVAIRPWGRD
jgi:predicted nucleic acid-binding protein